MNDEAYARVEEARIVLEFLGLDAERSNERSAQVLMALLRLTPSTPWADAEAPILGTRAIMDWIRDEYGTAYAPNTRETIRRFTLHQFVDAALVVENPDEPQRPVNSPRWCYQVSSPALELIRLYGTDGFHQRLDQYLQDVPGLADQYRAAREMRRIPVTLPDGSPVTLSPGGQNLLLQQMIENFCPVYAPGGQVLYIGDADNKWAVFREAELAALGVTTDRHGKMPDLVVYLPDRNWLLLMEAASTHGPVDGQRHSELASLFSGSTAGLVYVSCFPSRAVMRKYTTQIAWETEAWCAEDPTHLIHFNGERFLGPYE
ncbi:MAG: restriction endonuclease [Propionibacteriaceae bacterium]|nr:restriction endonuclease [Propionibacteriaceae bacterium]